MCSTAFYKKNVRCFISYKFEYFDRLLMYSSPHIKYIYFDRSEKNNNNKSKHKNVR